MCKMGGLQVTAVRNRTPQAASALASPRAPGPPSYRHRADRLSGPAAGVVVSIVRAASDEGHIIATIYSEDQLAFASETEMEVR